MGGGKIEGGRDFNKPAHLKGATCSLPECNPAQWPGGFNPESKSLLRRRNITGAAAVNGCSQVDKQADRRSHSRGKTTPTFVPLCVGAQRRHRRLIDWLAACCSLSLRAQRGGRWIKVRSENGRACWADAQEHKVNSKLKAGAEVGGSKTLSVFLLTSSRSVFRSVCRSHVLPM